LLLYNELTRMLVELSPDLIHSIAEDPTYVYMFSGSYRIQIEITSSVCHDMLL